MNVASRIPFRVFGGKRSAKKKTRGKYGPKNFETKLQLSEYTFPLPEAAKSFPVSTCGPKIRGGVVFLALRRLKPGQEETVRISANFKRLTRQKLKTS